ncbi:hypothetical protein PsYK624_157690 [Phanerochaete sordida]|uniref:Uncharacterized protein n=1 Tax=Phanerochaete sordida TaxID=48140 RepID=A0A9P3LLL2_9APHY|nr:hypothetical protein PsYK624_157690 [Phanerochaete sordida]
MAAVYGTLRGSPFAVALTSSYTRWLGRACVACINALYGKLLARTAEDLRLHSARLYDGDRGRGFASVACAAKHSVGSILQQSATGLRARINAPKRVQGRVCVGDRLAALQGVPPPQRGFAGGLHLHPEVR